MSGTFNLNHLVTATAEIDSITKTLLPGNPDVSLGASYAPFKELWVSGNTINLGGVALKGTSNVNDGFVFQPEGALKLDNGGSESLTLNAGDGISFGSNMSIGKTYMTVGSGSNAAVIGSNIYDRMTEISAEQARVQFDATSTAGDYGFLLDYELSFNSNNTIATIGGGNFEIGKKMNKKESLGLNTFVIKEVDNPLFQLSSDGSSAIVVEAEKLNKKNQPVDGNYIKVALGSIDTDKHLIPIERHVNFRDMFPFNVLDPHRQEGAAKFKADFDNVGQFLYTDDGSKFSGLNALNGYVQLSHPDMNSQHGTTFGVAPLTIKLNEYESVVEFISYSHLPLLFENQYNTNTDLQSFEYYSSSEVNNRLDNRVYKSQGAAPISEQVNGETVTLYGLNLNIQYESGTNRMKKFYPTIRVIKWKNTYEAVFTRIGTSDFGGDFLTALGWGDPTINKSTIVTKYISGTKMGENWIMKLSELTYAYLKYGKPLKTLNSVSLSEVTTVYDKIVADPNRYIGLNEEEDELSIEIKKEAFQGILYIF
tara:strand:+ start:2732 stop:4342 length:1611 start_codon:yes stop_codon:yes gene_type:complete